MTLTGRTLLGAACGAMVVLALHPVSCPFILTPFTTWGASKTFKTTPLLIGNHPVLTQPKDDLDYSLWMQTGARKILLQEQLSKENLQMLVDVAAKKGSLDVDNAYWPQMQAVFLDRAGRRPEAKRAWARAAQCGRWDDLQGTVLKNIQQQLASEAGGAASWQYAALTSLRNEEAVRLIERLGRDFVRNSDRESRDGLLIRYNTLMNGKHVRDGSKSLLLGEDGANLVEIAAYPKEMVPPGTPHGMILTRTEFCNKLSRAGYSSQADRARKVLNDNDAWLALTGQEQIADRAAYLRAGSIVTIALPGALLAIALLGALIWLFSALLKAKPSLLKVIEPPIAPALGLILAIAVYSATGLVLASIAVVACFAFLAFTPSNERSHPPQQLGPIFELTIFALASVFVLLLCFFLIGVSTPGSQVMPELNAPKEFYGGSTLFLALAAMVLGLVLLAAPSWAIVQRISTPSVVVMTFKLFGRGIFLWCLCIGIIITPLAILADRHLTGELQQIVLNEPLYYLNQ